MEEIGLSNNKNYKVADIFGYVMFIAYPLIFHNYFYDIVTCKFIALIVITLILMIFTLALRNKDENSGFIKICTNEEKWIFLLLLVNVISFLMSDYKLEALIGAEGRNNGIITIIMYFIIYLCLRNSNINKEKMLVAVLIGSVFVSTFGILNFLDIDFLGFYDGLSMQYKQFYISTLGHVNVYSSYFSITLPVAVLMLFKEDKLIRKSIYFVLTILNIIGLICGGCESAIIIIGVSFLCVLVREKSINFSLWYVVIIMTIILNKILVIANAGQSEIRNISMFMEVLSDDRFISFIIIAGAFLVIFSYIIKKHNKNKIIKKIVLSIIFSLIIVFLVLVVYFTFFQQEDNENINGFRKYFTINDEFGSYRGYIWKVILNEFVRLDFVKKLIGIGPDTVYPFLLEKYGNDMYVVTDAYYDNAHNEILQYLITTGILGVLMYMGFLLTKTKRFIKNRKIKKSVYEEIIFCSCLCYFIQSIVNLNQVVTTPLFVILICVL